MAKANWKGFLLQCSKLYSTHNTNYVCHFKGKKRVTVSVLSLSLKNIDSFNALYYL